MGRGICYIVCAGSNYGLDFIPGPEDLVVAADGGLTYLRQAGMTAGLVVGDFDTLGHRPEGEQVVALPREKDVTDTHAAVQEGLARGFAEFHIYCGTGGRIDHTLANIQMLAGLAQQGVKALLVDQHCVLTVLKDGCVQLPARETGTVSVFALSDRAEGVSIRGLKYPLEEAELKNTFPLGVSNEFRGEPGEISVREGTLLLVLPR